MDVPMPSKAMLNHMNILIVLVAPIGQGTGTPLIRHHTGVALIACLAYPCFPGALFTGIGTIIVAAFQRMFGSGFWSHIIQKITGRMPTFSDDNTTPAIVMIGLVFRIITALHHGIPDSIFRGLATAMNRLHICPTSTA